jgi:hypothetical protein
MTGKRGLYRAEFDAGAPWDCPQFSRIVSQADQGRPSTDYADSPDCSDSDNTEVRERKPECRTPEADRKTTEIGGRRRDIHVPIRSGWVIPTSGF